ncbi:hypothetical protein [Roseateles sp.]|uniref:hypothetical protein n=1 Tax=Roseateles sp. TaxID=1971397 RepID=UPI003BAC98B3
MRRFGWAVLWALAASGAAAQTAVVQKSEAQRLACLVKPAREPAYPARDKLDRAVGGMRVLLKFTQPDAAPTVEVLFNAAREDMQDAVYRYLRGYRLPCLTAADGAVTAVQEFSFSNTDRDATPLDATRRDGDTPMCIVMPRRDPPGYRSFIPPDVEHVVAAITFSGDGQQAPEVRFVYSTGNDRFEEQVKAYVADYRMPCRKAGAAPQMLQQQFSLFPMDRSRYGWKQEAFGLAKFLGMTREPGKLQAHHDFNTMGCPFKVRYSVYGGSVPNEATVAGKPDPNKQPFLAWLSSLELAFKNERQARDFFGTQLQIDVPCTVLSLTGDR